MRTLNTIVFLILSPLLLLFFGIFMITRKVSARNEASIPIKVYKTPMNHVIIRRGVA
ncbi:MAG: hypothetical protein K2N86_03180 [Rikenellaceae bacterium]|nr:hypothetical protein [Rikenellaceae bacterium]MDE7356496.1 hypothetical protein [Rikenellaceae bacterium]